MKDNEEKDRLLQAEWIIRHQQQLTKRQEDRLFQLIRQAEAETNEYINRRISLR